MLTYKQKKNFWQTFWLGGNVLGYEGKDPNRTRWSIRQRWAASVQGVSLPWLIIVQIIVGVWLMARPSILPFNIESANCDHWMGAIIVTVAAVAAAEVTRIARFVNVIAGVMVLIRKRSLLGRNGKKYLIALLYLPGFLSGQHPSPTSPSETEKEIKPLPIGNFSVPIATQIAPLIGFGQLLVGEKCMLPQLSGSYTRGRNGYANIIEPNLTYGIRDDLDLALFVPFTPRSQSRSSHSSGIMDMILQGEYAYYTKSYIDHTLTGSIVVNVQFPTGSDSKNPRTGNGSFTYFLGTTFAYSSYNWYAFVSPGANLTTSHHGTKLGNTYLYQCGFARYIPQLSPKGWIFDLMVEFDGTYAEKDKIHGETDRNSGGNVIFVTPSIWMSSKLIVLQWGIGFPLLQNLNREQDKIRYSIAYNLGIAFQF